MITYSIKTNKRLGVIIAELLCLIIIPIVLRQSSKIISLPNLLIFFGGIVFFILTVWNLLGQVTIIIDKNLLIIKRQLLNFTIQTKKYELTGIKNIIYLTNQNERTYTNLKGILIYDKCPTLIQFTYQDRMVEIGRTLKEFNADEIIRKIKEQQQSVR